MSERACWHAVTAAVVAVLPLLGPAATAGDEPAAPAGPVVVASQPALPVRLASARVTTHGGVVDYEVSYAVEGSVLVRGVEWGYVLLDSACRPVLEGVATDQVYPRALSHPDSARTLRATTNTRLAEDQVDLASSWHFFYLLGVEMLDGSRYLGDVEDIAHQLETAFAACARSKAGTAGTTSSAPSETAPADTGVDDDGATR